MKPSRLLHRAMLLLAGSAGPLLADEVALEWIPTGFSARIGYYSPQRAQLSATKPETVTKLPEGVTTPQFSTLTFGAKDDPKKVVLLLDESNPEQSHLWIDANGNGDLTDDPVPKWSSQTGTGAKWRGSVSIPVTFDGQERQLGLQLYRFDPATPRGANMKDVVFFYRDFGLSGKGTIGGKSYTMVVSDELAQADFAESSGTRLGIDVNGDDKFDSRAELFSPKKPFNIAGVTYEIAGLKAGGTSFQVEKSEETVPETPVPAATAVGSKITAFEDKTIDGATVRFPDDYKGKLVLLEFWATWCGPCVAEVPNVLKVHEEFHPKGFEILGVSLDNERTMEKLKPFLQEKGITWPQIADGKGWEAKLAGVFGVHSIPASFLVDGTTGLLVASAEELRGPSLRTSVEQALGNLGKAPNLANHPPKPAPPAAEPEDPLIKRARALTQIGELPTAEKFLETLKHPTPLPITLGAPGTQPLRGREIADRATAAHVRVGWMFQCTKCSRWHSTLAGGYAIARDTIVTAHHVLEPPENMKAGTGIPVALRGADQFIPIRTVIADDATADAIVLRVGVDWLQPLSIASDVRIGDSVYCLSDPRNVAGYFSTGIVNRRYIRTGGREGNPVDERLHVSTDWAQGSSGSAVLDECGNVVGHVARIRTLMGARQPDSTAPPSVMSLHEAIPASCVLHILNRPAAVANAGTQK